MLLLDSNLMTLLITTLGVEVKKLPKKHQWMRVVANTVALIVLGCVGAYTGTKRLEILNGGKDIFADYMGRLLTR